MNLIESMEKASEDVINFAKHEKAISVDDAIKIAEDYAIFKLGILLGHFRRKTDYIEESLGLTYDRVNGKFVKRTPSLTEKQISEIMQSEAKRIDNYMNDDKKENISNTNEMLAELLEDYSLQKESTGLVLRDYLCDESVYRQKRNETFEGFIKRCFLKENSK